jgi:hypothetical protein
VIRHLSLSVPVLVFALAAACDFGDALKPQTGQPDTEHVTLLPVRDNTLYETTQGEVSNGAGVSLFVGMTGPNAGVVVRRGVLAFDVAAAVPAGATIDSVGLELHLAFQSPSGGPSSVALHRILAGWGEGTSDAGIAGGDGAAATPGDATWLHRVFDTDRWSSPGGDFLPAASASIVVGDRVPGYYEWTGDGLVADVQSMLDDPAGNFGWILVGDEGMAHSAKRFDTKEHGTPDQRPRLLIRYTLPPPAPSS